MPEGISNIKASNRQMAGMADLTWKEKWIQYVTNSVQREKGKGSGKEKCSKGYGSR